MKPKFTDNRRRYHDSEATKAPGYLARRMKAYRRLQRLQERAANVQPLRKKEAA